jgi:putative ABC transport system substrate-binding protein
MESAKSAREAARRLKIDILERHVASVEQLRLGLAALKAQEVDAYFYINDAMVTSQAQLIIDTAKARKLATMFGDSSLVAHGALVGYGVSYYEVGRLSAKYVRRVLGGTSPRNLPVESFSSRVEFELKTARAWRPFRSLSVSRRQGYRINAGLLRHVRRR